MPFHKDDTVKDPYGIQYTVIKSDTCYYELQRGKDIIRRRRDWVDTNFKPVVAGWTRKTMGKRAKELGVALGEIACPNCGSVASGALQAICQMCDKPYWSYIRIKNEKKKS